MNAKPVVSKLRALAAEPAHRAAIVRDQGCLPGLILFLDNDDPEVVTLALEALDFLSQCTANKPLMLDELGLMESIETILRTGSSKHKQIAARIKKNLESAAGSRTSKRTGSLNKSSGNVVGAFSSGNQSFFKGQTNKKARNFIFQLEPSGNAGARQSAKDAAKLRQRVEETLLEIKGVISFTFEAETTRKGVQSSSPEKGKICSRITVRCKSDVTAEQIMDVLCDVKGLHAQQIIKGLNGEETLVKPVDESNKENLNEPDYLDDNEDKVTESEKSKTALFLPRWGWWKDKKSKDVNNGGSGWFGGIGNYISKTLYGST